VIFEEGCIKVRELGASDAGLLAKWLSNPTVLEFYEGRDNPFDLDKVNEVFYAQEDDEVKCIIEYDEKEIGYIQFYPLDDETKREYGYPVENENIYGMDQFIGEADYWNKGIGTLLVTSMIKYLTGDRQADRVVMDPQTRNARAIRCYEKCGFRKVRLLPQNELHEGKYQDCWLIEYTRT
jgi:aminoglycoside 6'-N-acetyltransferase